MLKTKVAGVLGFSIKKFQGGRTLKETIFIKNAYENNLKNVSVSIPKNKLVVLTGPSGSGKSTLAMDILQRECLRQYMESLGMVTYGVSKPKVESMIGLSPSISIGQHVTNRNPRSTVGTLTDIYTYIRFIYEKLRERECPNCQPMIRPTLDKEELHEEFVDNKVYIQCPKCQHPLEKLTFSHFSFNTPEGSCETCEGPGEVITIRKELVFDENLTLQNR